jgi:hypothetical protein
MADESDDLGAEGEATFVLTPRNQPIPGQFRTVRRLALIAMMLRACRGEQATLPQLHVLNWAVRTPGSRRAFLAFWNGEVPPDEAIVRFDPTLPRAIQYAVEERIVSDRAPLQETLDGKQESKAGQYRIALTEKGKALAEAVEDAGLLVDERIFLESLSKKVTQVMVDELLDWGRG